MSTNTEGSLPFELGRKNQNRRRRHRLSLDLYEGEMLIVERLSQELGMSKTAVMRNALAAYSASVANLLNKEKE